MKKIVLSILILIIGFLTFIQIQAQIPCVQRKTGILENDTTKLKTITNKNIREADIAWTKRTYSLIKFKEKRNNIFQYKNSLEYGKSGFIDILYCALQNVIIKAYEDENFKIPYNYIKIDSVPEDNPDTGIPETHISMKIFNANDIVALKIKEDWLIDKNFNLLDARIIGICPMIIERDTAGDLVRTKEMFWIYYLDLQKLLVNIDIVNPLKPTEKISWDSIFIKRIFTSSIVKESNTRDQNVTDYRTGQDAIIESDKIKGTTLDMDQDLKDN